jgi:SAM-dependent methyltransferase
VSVAEPAVTEFFDADAANWDAYYERRDVFSVIHQLRRSLALAWIDELALPSGARVLEVGCGTGLVAVAMARRGLIVTAADSAANMLARARANAAAAGVADSVTLLRAEADGLPVPDGAFDAVVALGLVPWVPSPPAAVAEMARAVAPGGHVVVNCDNRWRLPVLLDPRYAPALAGARAAVRRLRGRSAGEQAGGATTVRHTPPEFDGLLASAGLTVERGATFGFGPFTLLGRGVLPAGPGVAVHRGLQGLADRGVPGFRSTGTQYLVRAVRAAEPRGTA